ncbi:aspartate aminotransferase family protein [Methylovulum psychrotolerans]|uniref:Aspartate aminotransferase family protein n=1 Tax=Methylovulum psychrotolerans TaxID=1704499 RepID=A0A2S5CMH7_9GAMM|nr:aspartate aminotransferase family protein [Methylovulum psychrotolerans]
MTLSKNLDSNTIGQNALKARWAIYEPATSTTLDTIWQRNQAGKATFLLASQPVFAESAQAAYLLCEYINALRNKAAKDIYKTFFCNSRIEALHGAIKISRHNARLSHPDNDGLVLVYDQERYYADLFDPLSQGIDKALVPGVLFYEELADLSSQLNNSSTKAAAVVMCLYDDFPLDELNRIQHLCREKQTILVLNTAHASCGMTESSLAHLADKPDIVVWGEALTDYQVPFGAFSVLDRFYKPWAKVSTCFMHSSTYGGNSLVTSMVRDKILKSLPITAKIAAKFNAIADKPAARIKAFCTYINPITPLICHAAKLDLDITQAKGTKITIKNQSTGEIDLIDCIGGAGSNLRGYNPADIGQALEAHQPDTDYWSELARLLSGLVGLDHAFPAVSGACAVDIAITLAMLANPQRSRIVIFKGNYAGKSLISLNGSEDEFDRKPFVPLYWDIVYLDIFSPTADVDLLQQLRSGEIALVWFEVMQGNSLNQVPPKLIDIIFQYRKDLGYIVGIDEILNGMFRTGSFVSFDRDQYQPDIITLSKGLSDLTFPISAVLVSDTVYQQAKHTNEQVVTRYENQFLNQLGAHIALNGLTQANAPGNRERIRYAGNRLKSELWGVAGRAPLLKGIRGEGLHLHLMLDMEQFPLSLFGKDVSELLISRLCLSEGHVLQYFCRLLPPLNISDREMEQLVVGIEKSLKISRFSLFLFGLKQILVFLYLLSVAQLKSAITGLTTQLSGLRYGNE